MSPADTPLLSGPVATVPTRSGTRAAIHRHDYQQPVLGGFTAHGYGWRCPACTHTTTGYTTYGSALAEARTHHCQEGEEPHG